MKIMTIVGTRPEIIKLAPTLLELDKYFEHIIVHTGQNYDYELNEVFFQELKLRKPNYFLDTVGENLAQTIGNIISKSDAIMAKENPDALLLYGDTNSCLSVISAKRRKIPIFHMEAGNRCFDARVPEEINRKIVDHMSDINMTITEHARRYLIQEGIRPDRIIKIGSSIKELIQKYQEEISQSKILDKLDLKPKEYFVFSSHREENIDSEININNLFETLNYLADKFNKSIVFSTHPRTKKVIEKKGIFLNSLIQLHRPFGFFDYITLQKNALCVLSDSGTITEESSIMSFPAINIREAHERPEGMDEGTVIMSGLNKIDIEKAIEITVNQYKENSHPFKIVTDYEVDNVSKKVVKIILSYTGYINRETWKKE